MGTIGDGIMSGKFVLILGKNYIIITIITKPCSKLYD
jgi:hypothetical protein